MDDLPEDRHGVGIVLGKIVRDARFAAMHQGPAELVAASDVVVDGPAGMLAVLEALLQT